MATGNRSHFTQWQIFPVNLGENVVVVGITYDKRMFVLFYYKYNFWYNFFKCFSNKYLKNLQCMSRWVCCYIHNNEFNLGTEYF